MHRRVPTVLSVLLLAFVLAVALWLQQRAPEPAPPPTPEPAFAPPPARPDGLHGPGSLAEAGPALRPCHAEHGAALGYEPALTLVFSIEVDSSAPSPMARVVDVRVRGEDEDVDHSSAPDAFEACAHEVVKGLELIPPGGRDSIDIPLKFELGG